MDIELARQLIQEYDNNKIEIENLDYFIQQLNKIDDLKEENNSFSVAMVGVSVTINGRRIQLNRLNTMDGNELKEYLIKLFDNEKQALEDLNKQIENS